MSVLQSNLEYILNEKETKIIPENIKKGVQIFDVVGTLEASGGPLTTEEYDTCNNLAAIALGETPLIDDPNVSVTLDVSNNDTVKVENNTLIIEEVTE